MSGEANQMEHSGTAVLTADAPHKRGRPTKAEQEAREAVLAQEAARALESIAANAPRKRGRPSNAERQVREAAQAAMENIVNAPRKRGRPSKNDLAARAAAQAAVETISGAPRKRGRPSRAEREAREATLAAGAAAIIDVLPTMLQGPAGAGRGALFPMDVKTIPAVKPLPANEPVTAEYAVADTRPVAEEKVVCTVVETVVPAQAIPINTAIGDAPSPEPDSSDTAAAAQMGAETGAQAETQTETLTETEAQAETQTETLTETQENSLKNAADKQSEKARGRRAKKRAQREAKRAARNVPPSAPAPVAAASAGTGGAAAAGPEGGGENSLDAFAVGGLAAPGSETAADGAALGNGIPSGEASGDNAAEGGAISNGNFSGEASGTDAAGGGTSGGWAADGAFAVAAGGGVALALDGNAEAVPAADEADGFEDEFIPAGKPVAFHFAFWPTILLAYVFPALNALTIIRPALAQYFYVASALCVFAPVAILIVAFVLNFVLYEKNYYLSKGFLWGAIVSVALPVIVTLIALGKCIASLA